MALKIYLHFFNSYSATYGSLAGVIVLLLWFYFSGIAVLSGAAINAVLEKVAAPPAAVQQEQRDTSPFKAA